MQMLFALSPSLTLSKARTPWAIFSMSGAVLPAQHLMAVSSPISGSDLTIPIPSNSWKPHVTEVNWLLQLSCRLAYLLRPPPLPSPSSQPPLFWRSHLLSARKYYGLFLTLKLEILLWKEEKKKKKCSGGAGRGSCLVAGFYMILNKSLIVTESFGYCCRTSDNNVH